MKRNIAKNCTFTTRKYTDELSDVEIKNISSPQVKMPYITIYVEVSFLLVKEIHKCANIPHATLKKATKIQKNIA